MFTWRDWKKRRAQGQVIMHLDQHTGKVEKKECCTIDRYYTDDTH